MSMKNPLTLAGIEQATFRFVEQHINHCATAVLTALETRYQLCVLHFVPTHSRKESTRLSFPLSVAHLLTPWRRILLEKLNSS